MRVPWYLPVPGVAMAAGDERYGGGITTPGGKPTMSVMAFGFDTFSDASYACWEVHTRWAEKMKKRFGGLPNIRDFISYSLRCVFVRQSDLGGNARHHPRGRI